MDWHILGPQIALGTLLGLLIGYTLKKALKVVMVVMGAFFIAVILANHFDLVSINWEVFEAAYLRYMDRLGGVYGIQHGIIRFFAANIPAAGSFSLGFLVGLKWG